MPLDGLRRRDSWPPAMLRYSDDESHVEDDAHAHAHIDADPFSYFLTSPDDIDFDDQMDDLTAGIEAQDNSSISIREVSPSSLQRNPLDVSNTSETTESVAVPINLRDISSSHEPRRARPLRLRQYSTLPAAGRDRIALLPSSRGRGIVKSGAENRGRTSTRTRNSTSLRSRPRPHSWREPSPDVWSIAEGDEEEEEGKENDQPVGKDDVDERSDGEMLKGDRPKKRVRWAIPEATRDFRAGE